MISVLVILGFIALLLLYKCWIDRNRLSQLKEELTEKSFFIDEISGQLVDKLQHQHNFLSSLTHDVKNPIHSILALSEILKDSEIDTEKRKQLECIFNSSQQLNALLSEALKFNSGIFHSGELKQIHEHSTRIELVQWFKNWIIRMQSMTAGTQFHVDSQLTCSPHFPELLLERMFEPVLLNCLKASNIWVTLKLQGDADLEVVISNDGPSIPEKLLPFLFHPFVKNPGADQASLGLGLYQTSHYAKLISADVSLKNRKPYGVTYRFLLPRVAEFPTKI